MLQNISISWQYGHFNLRAVTSTCNTFLNSVDISVQEAAYLVLRLHGYEKGITQCHLHLFNTSPRERVGLLNSLMKFKIYQVIAKKFSPAVFRKDKLNILSVCKI